VSSVEEYDKPIIRRIQKSIAQCTRHRIWEALLLSFLIVGTFLLLCVLLANFMPSYAIVPIAKPLLLLFLVAVPPLSILLFALRRPGVEEHAFKLEKLNPQMRDKLVTAVQLSRSRRTKEGYSTALIDAFMRRTHGLLGNMQLKEPVNTFRFHLLVRSGFAIAIFFFVLAAFIPDRLYLPLFTIFGNAPLPDRTVLKVFPGDTVVMKGSSLGVSITPYGKIPRKISFLYREGDGDWIEETCGAKGIVKKDFSRIVNEIHYKAKSKESSTREYTIGVTYPPELTDLFLKYVYPSYTRLPPMTSTKSNGSIVALAGTKVYVNGEASQDLSAAKAIVEEDTVTGEVNGREFVIPLVVDRDCYYTIELSDVYGNRSVDPPKFSITAIPDEYPSVRIVKPAGDIDMPRDMIVSMQVRVTDDFGISKAELVYSLEGVSKRTSMEIADVNDTVLVYRWDLTGLGLLPGQSVSYFVEVLDNDTYSGPKRAKSEAYSVHFPTLEEIYERIAEEEERGIEEIATIVPEQEEIRRQLDEIATKLKTTKDMGWEKKEIVEEVIEKQRQVVEEMERLSEQIQAAVDRLEEGLVVDEEILMKLDEVAQLLREVMTDEMREALRKLEEAMESLKPEEIEAALRELQFTQEELRESLERTLEILNRMKQERKLKQLAEEASQLYERERELKGKTEEARSGEELKELSSKQEEIREQLEQLKDELSSLAKELPEISDLLEESAQNSLGTLAKMSKASEALSKGMKRQSLSSEEEALADLSALEQNLSFASSSLSSARKKEVLEAMEDAMKDLVYLSKLQEELGEQISEAMTKSGIETTDLAISESALERGVEKVADRIYGISQKTLFITPATGRFLGMAKARMKEAEGLLEEGKVSKAREKAREAMKNLNQAALSLRRSLSSCQASACAAGVQECLQNMAGLASRQAALNAATQSLPLFDVGEGALSLEARAQMARLAAEQRAIQEGTAQLAETFSERAELAGRLDDVVSEMEEIARSLERNQLDRSIVERQERILSRLLDAQRSVRQRDYTSRRQAQPGEDVSGRESPPSLSEEQREKRAREDMLRALREGYPPEYENLIKAYFKALSE